MTYYEIHQWVPDEEAAANQGYWWTWMTKVETIERAQQLIESAYDQGFKTFKVYECREVVA